MTVDIAMLSEAQRRVLLALSGEFRPAPNGVSRQAVAALAWKQSSLIEREWQDGCAQCTYYRLTPLGLQVREILERAA